MLCSAFLTTDHFRILDVFQLHSSNKDEVNLCMVASRRKGNNSAFIPAKENVGNCKLVGWTKIKNVQPGVPCSKPLDGSIVDSALHPSEVDKMSTSF